MIVLLSLTLNDYLKGVRRHPDVLAVEKRAESYAGRSLKALFPPHPVLTYNAMFMDGAISLSQPLSPSWPFGALAAKREEMAQRWRAVNYTQTFLLMAVEAYADAYFLTEKVKVLEEMLGNLKSAKLSLMELYSIGKADGTDVKRLQARIGVLEAELEDTRAELDAKMEMLRYFYGEDPDTLILPEIDSLSLEGIDWESSPSVKAHFYERDFFEMKRKAAILSLIPTVSPGVLFKEGEISFSLSLSLPIWIPAYIGEITSSSRKAEGARLKLEGERRRLRATVLSEYERYRAHIRRKEELERALRDLRTAYESEALRYKTTGRGLTDYLYVQNEVLDLKLKILEVHLKAVKSLYSIRALLGDI